MLLIKINMCEIKYDSLGPQKVIHLHFPVADFRAIVVIDNTALGTAIGGVRVSPAVTTQEVARLARAMTLKNSIAGLPHGGGKAGLILDHRHPDIEHCFRVFARQIRELHSYIPGPDMGSSEKCMAWIYDETGKAVGLPEEIGGLPLDKLGATGFGLAECAEIACPYANIELNGASVSIHGFGSVGRAAAKFLSAKGAIITAVCDTHGAVYNPEGLEVNKLIEIKKSTGSVVNYSNAAIKKSEEIFALKSDILIPAATADVINEDNVHEIKARLILQGANIPATTKAEDILHKKAILSVPDFIANAGGVIMAALEYAKKSEKEAFETISERIKKNTRQILEKTIAENMPPRQAAENLAKQRVLSAMSYRKDL